MGKSMLLQFNKRQMADSLLREGVTIEMFYYSRPTVKELNSGENPSGADLVLRFNKR